MYTKKTTDIRIHKNRRKYTEDFKRKTVNEFNASNMTLNAFSKQAGIEYTVIWKWISKYGETNTSFSEDKPVTPDDIVMLKHEISQIKISVETLKKILSKSFQDKYKQLTGE
jgi:transposase-like protein